MTKEIPSKQEQIRERIIEFYKTHESKGKVFTYKHFLTEGIPKATTCRIIKRHEEGISGKRIKGNGRIAKIMTSENINKLAKMFNHNDKISQRQASRKFNCHRSLIYKTIQKYTNIKYHKKTKIPKRTETQQKDAKRKCGILFKKYKNCDWIIDDESYFTLSHSSIYGNNTFYSSHIKDTLSNIKYKTSTKYESKLLVWICISEFGISTPYFQESGLAINQEMYLNQCIKKRLLPFIKKYSLSQ